MIKKNPKFDQILDRSIKDGLLNASEFLKSEIKKKLGSSGGTSSPGQPPSKQSGDLQDSIQIDKSNINNKRTRIGSDEDYAAALEGGNSRIAPRPFLRPAFRENKAGVIREFNKGGKNK